jgi:SPP1 family phage portal protein
VLIISRLLTGRRIITTDVAEINSGNLLEVLSKTKTVHDLNKDEIEYLYNVYKGKQEILGKTKEVRKDINNIITENRAYEIVSFKRGHVFGEPIQYIRRGEEESLTGDITKLNDYMIECDKGEIDSELAEWILIGGVGYRMTLPNSDWEKEGFEPPFKIFTLDPRCTYVVRYNDLEKKVLMGVTYTVADDLSITYYVYTKNKYYVVKADQIVDEQDVYMGDVIITEYVSGSARLGAFEVVLPLLDAINSLQSNRLDDVEQHVNSFLAVYGADIDDDTYKKVEAYKMLILPDGADAKYLSATLHQTDVQTFADSLYQNILTICGMPNRNGGSSTSDTGSAVLLRDGWESAEAQAKSLEKTFKKSEREFLKLVLRILKDMGGTSLNITNIDIKFARRYTDNILTKTQALTQLLDAGIKPEIAIATCGIWNDPTDVAVQSKPYLDKWTIEDEPEEEVDNDVPVDGQEIIEAN